MNSILFRAIFNSRVIELFKVANLQSISESLQNSFASDPRSHSSLLHVLPFIFPPDVVASVAGHILMALWRIVNCVIIYFCHGDHCVITPPHSRSYCQFNPFLRLRNMNFNYFNDFRLISEFEFCACARAVNLINKYLWLLLSLYLGQRAGAWHCNL